MIYFYRMKEFKISGMPYTPTILFFMGENEETRAYIKKKYKYTIFDGDPDFKYIEGGCIQFLRQNKYYTPCIWISSYSSPIIAHETLHLTFKILNRAGIYHTPNSEEAFTYYQQYLFDQIIDRYNKLFPEDWIE